MEKVGILMKGWGHTRRVSAKQPGKDQCYKEPEGAYGKDCLIGEKVDLYPTRMISSLYVKYNR